ncbi:hypothetical protein BCR44DRAFT_1423815 [Catenaria anguillulae PL171]|uniref:Uncharacterized protein n=1 Tax=Catenaria anguillulae PL171 TaxID=765915 RepID=A0A1Y2I4B0_9FUNG|nr:hypothetical protein BCR44DRAFT_1423815 [Catenaria anguillulae PL171]
MYKLQMMAALAGSLNAWSTIDAEPGSARVSTVRSQLTCWMDCDVVMMPRIEMSARTTAML